MGDDEDATNMAMVHIHESNNVSTHFLLCNGYNDNAFKDTIKKVSRKSELRKFKEQQLTALSFMQQEVAI